MWRSRFVGKVEINWHSQKGRQVTIFQTGTKISHILHQNLCPRIAGSGMVFIKAKRFYPEEFYKAKYICEGVNPMRLRR